MTVPNDLAVTNALVTDILAVPKRFVAGRLVAKSVETDLLFVNGNAVSGIPPPPPVPSGLDIVIAQNLVIGSGAPLVPPTITILKPFNDIINTGNNFNSTTGTYTVATSGSYKSSVNVTFVNQDAAPASVSAYILQNGQVVASTTSVIPGNNATIVVAFTPIALLPAGTTIQSAVSSTGVNVVTQNTIFSVSRTN